MGTDSQGIRTSDEEGEELEDTMKWMDQEAAGRRRMVMDKNSTSIKKKIAMAAVLVGAVLQHSDFLIHP